MKNLLLICISCFIIVFLACNSPSTDTGNADTESNDIRADSVTPSDTLYPQTDTSMQNLQ
jgi:hypothetical protein